VHAAGEFPQLLERAGEPFGHGLQLVGQVAGLGWHRRPRHPQVERQRDQVLLGAVVKVALDPAPGRVGGDDDPGPGGGQGSLGFGVGQRGSRRVR